MGTLSNEYYYRSDDTAGASVTGSGTALSPYTCSNGRLLWQHAIDNGHDGLSPSHTKIWWEGDDIQHDGTTITADAGYSAVDGIDATWTWQVWKDNGRYKTLTDFLGREYDVVTLDGNGQNEIWIPGAHTYQRFRGFHFYDQGTALHFVDGNHGSYHDCYFEPTSSKTGTAPMVDATNALYDCAFDLHGSPNIQDNASSGIITDVPTIFTGNHIWNWTPSNPAVRLLPRATTSSVFENNVFHDVNATIFDLDTDGVSCARNTFSNCSGTYLIRGFYSHNNYEHQRFNRNLLVNCNPTSGLFAVGSDVATRLLDSISDNALWNSAAIPDPTWVIFREDNITLDSCPLFNPSGGDFRIFASSPAYKPLDYIGAFRGVVDDDLRYTAGGVVHSHREMMNRTPQL